MIEITQIILLREFDASPAVLSRAHTEPDLLAQWLGPASLTTTAGSDWSRALIATKLDITCGGVADRAAGRPTREVAPVSEPAYVATPIRASDRPGPWPGVVVVHDALGPSDDMREQADWLAAAGYVAAIPDLYDGKGAIRCVKGAIAQLSAQRGPMFDRLDAARQWLAGQPDCTGRVGVIGYCMGGGFALLLAGRSGWSAASVNYGPVPRNIAEVLAGACPIVASYGGKDRGLSGAADKLRAAIPAGVDADIKEYPEARHSFLNRLAVASPLVPVMKVAGVGYHHPAAADAKTRILTFFDRHLRQG